MRVRSMMLLLLSLALALVGVASAASAQSGYGAGDGSVAQGTFVPGGTVSIRSPGWQAGSPVKATLFSDPIDLGSFTADGSGLVVGTVTIPSTVPLGQHTLQLSGTRADGTPRVLSQAVTVNAADEPNTGQGTQGGTQGGGQAAGSSSGGPPSELLSRTGPRPLRQFLQASGVILAAGVFAIVLARKASLAEGKVMAAPTLLRRSRRRQRRRLASDTGSTTAR